jgi:AcrR family transcriptional regulator
MSTAPSRPALREKYERRQQELIASAAGVFAERGYDQTSVPELAAALGGAVGGIYHYFGSKEQLLMRICDQLMHPLLERAEAIEATALPPEEQLRRLVRLWVANVVEHRDHMLVFQQERHVIEAGEAWRGVRADRKRFERLADRILGRALGDSVDGHRRRLLLMAALGMVNHTAQWFRPRGSLTAEQVADGYVELLLSTRAAPEHGYARRGRVTA